jgi:Ca2+-binding RTX toxin-like protein
MLGRRTVLAAAAQAVLGACADRVAAQPARGPVLPAAPPCARDVQGIAGLVLEGTGAPAGTVVTFGQAFRPGDLPRDAALAARLADGRAVAVQADIKNRHPDGSVRFAVIGLAAPPLRAGERVGIVLARGGISQPQALLDVVAAGAGRSAVAELLGDEGNVTWRADLLLRAQDLMLQRAPASPLWRAGPLAVEARITMPVPPAALGGVTSARLIADLALCADGMLRTTLWLRNDGAMQAGGGRIRCGLRLLVDGREVLRRPPARQFQYTAWGRRAAVARGGAPAPAPPWVRHDVGLLADLGAVPRFDLSVGVNEDVLARLAAAMTAPAWNAPDDARGITRYLPTTGGRPDIGFTTGWQAIWLATGDRRAGEFVLGQVESGGAAPWHLWDAARGTWLNLQNYPKLWSDARGGTGSPGNANSTGLTQQIETYDFAGGGKGMAWELDRAHQPDLSYVPYLLTGERWVLDNLQAQSAWNTMAIAPGLRQGGQGLLVVPDPNNQVRDIAWSMRQIENALWASPDGSPEQAYFKAISNANWQYLVSKIPEWTAAQGETHGWIPSGMGAKGEVAPWQQDFFIGITALAASRGNAEALTFLNWQANYVVGRFTHGSEGMNPRDGVAYQLVMVDPASGQLLKTWAAVGAATTAGGYSNGTGWDQSGGYFGQLGLASLAVVHELTGNQAAADAYRALLQMRPPATDPVSLANIPTYAVTIPDIYDLVYPPGATTIPTGPTTPTTPTTPPAPLPDLPPASLTLGSGSDTLILKLAQDYFLSSAQYTLKVNGQQIGGTLTASALAANGQQDTVTLKGTWSSALRLEVNFLNDAWVSGQGDRNLYLQGVTLNGQALDGYGAMLAVTGGRSFYVPKAIAPQSLSFGSGSDTLVLKISQDFFDGNAQYTLKVNGAQVGGTLSAAAIKAYGQADTVTIKGDWGSTVSLSATYLNDSWGPGEKANRNLHIDSAQLNGADLKLAASLLSNGTQNFTFSKPAVPTPPPAATLPAATTGKAVTGDAAANTLVGSVGNDILEGKAGNDVLTGGAGADTFIFRPGDGIDRITDFASGADRILFKGIDPASLKAFKAAEGGVSGLKLSYGSGGDSIFLAGVSSLKAGDLVFSDVPAAPAAAPAPIVTGTAPTGFAPANITLGTGKDTLVLKLNQDFWSGSAQYTLHVNGQQIGGTLAASALKSSGLVDTVTLRGDFGDSVSLGVRFINDAWGGSTDRDRNLYIQDINLNGADLDGLGMAIKGSSTPLLFQVNKPTSLTFGTGNDTLVLKISQDFWKEAAQYTVSVNGTQIGGTLTAAAIKAYGQTDTITIKGNWGDAVNLSVRFLNDGWGGHATLDRNLHINSVQMNGVDLGLSQTLGPPISTTFSFAKPVALPAPTFAQLAEGTASANTLTGGAGADILQGGAGADVLTGGAGADTFIFRQGDGADRVTDFASGVDRLLFQGVEAASLKATAATVGGVSGLQIGYGPNATDSVFLAGVTSLKAGDLVIG